MAERPDTGPSTEAITAEIAIEVARMLAEHNALDRWRDMARSAFAEFQGRERAAYLWNERREAHFRAVWERDKGKEPPDEPPIPGYVLELEKVFTERGLEKAKQGEWGEKATLWAWVPPELCRDNQPLTDLPLPLPKHRSLSLAECYVVLAAIHDAKLAGVELIKPWTADDSSRPRSYYETGLLRRVNELGQADHPSLKVHLARVNADLLSAGNKNRGKPSNRGRRVDSDPKDDERISNAWNTGNYRTYDELARALDATGEIKGRDVKLAIDRHRKRLEKKESEN